MISKIIPCPVAVSETGYILIVGDATKAPVNPFSNYKWEYKALSYDPIKCVRYGKAFDVAKEEVEEWTMKQN